MGLDREMVSGFPDSRGISNGMPVPTRGMGGNVAFVTHPGNS